MVSVDPAQAASHAKKSTANKPIVDKSAPETAQQLSLTVYNNNLALVQDVRQMNVAAGRSRLEFKGVSSNIRPETVALSGKGLSIVEQNFDYDLLTPAKMMEKAVGKQIQIVRTNPATGAQATETATVLSVNNGVILKIGNRIEVLRDDGIPTRVVFSSIPENLRAEPTLSVTVDSADAGTRQTTLSYLTTGLTWRSDYVALFDEKQGTIRLQGWITLTNSSGTSFKNAKTQLVAGDVSFADSYDDQDWQSRRSANVKAGTMQNDQSALGDYYVYDLPLRVTVANSQTKQVGFLDLQGVKADKTYAVEVDGFDSISTPMHVDSILMVSSIAKALPVGTVRIYMRDVTGEPKFIGENPVAHAPAGSDLAIKLGQAFDVTMQATLVSSEKAPNDHTRDSMLYAFHNARAVPVTVNLKQGGLWRGGRVVDESLKSKRLDAGTLLWAVPVPAHGDATLTFTVDTGG
ncbi:MAG: DUF4139 domain-containing protein [Proteobacteria bacterium]|nr:DUF4139 domain-containing protein [Pseudomonadota bacterium]